MTYSIKLTPKHFFKIWFAIGFPGVEIILFLFLGATTIRGFNSCNLENVLFELKETEKVPGLIVNEEQKEGSFWKDALIRYDFVYRVDSTEYQGVVYSRPLRPRTGSEVVVEYLKSKPGVARPNGVEPGIDGVYKSLFLLLCSLGALVFIFRSLNRMMELRKTLLGFSLVTAEMIGNSKILSGQKDEHLFLLRYAYTVGLQNCEYEFETGEPRRFKKSETLICSVENPSSVMFLIHLPYSLREKIKDEQNKVAG